MVADVARHAPLVPESRTNSATSRRAWMLGDSLDDSALPPMRLMPVSPPSAGVAAQALPVVDWLDGLAPSLAHRGLLQASLQMALAERELLSSPPVSKLASRPASQLVSPTQFLLQPLVQGLPLSSPERTSRLASLQALALVSLERFLLQPLAQVSPAWASSRSSQARVP